MPAPPFPVFVIRNADRGTTLGTRVKVASSFIDRLLGLMMRREIRDGGGIFITHSTSIHSFFMRFRFDVIFIDADNRVARITPSMRQWWVAFGGRGAKDVIELPAGTAAATGTQPGDLLTYEASDED